MSEIYFDNGATTKPTEQVVRIMTQVLTEDYGNPSSLHRKGQAAERYVTEARKTIADCLHVPETTIYFTSGATESSNTALLGAAARAGKRRRILAWPGEHPATGESLKRLAEEGFDITYLPVDADGRADRRYPQSDRLDGSQIRRGRSRSVRRSRHAGHGADRTVNSGRDGAWTQGNGTRRKNVIFHF